MTMRRALLGTAAAALVGAAGYAGKQAFARRTAERTADVRAANGARLALEAGSAEEDLVLPADVVHHYIDVSDGGRVHVVERGNGPAIVLLHGAGLAATIWAYQFRDLGDRYRLLALDLRGHGESLSGSDGVTIAAMADDVGDVLTSLDVFPVLVVGHSMGGMTLLRLARRQPRLVAERVSAVLLLSTAAGVVPAIGPWNRLGPLAGRAVVAAGSIADRAGRGLPEGEVGRRMARFGFGVAPSTAQLDAVLTMMRSAQPSRLAGLVPELIAFDERAVFEDLRIPVTVVVGDRDHLTPPALARQLADAIGGARLVVWPGGGHMLMYERREALDWLMDRLASGADAAPEGDGGS